MAKTKPINCEICGKRHGINHYTKCTAKARAKEKIAGNTIASDSSGGIYDSHIYGSLKFTNMARGCKMAGAHLNPEGLDPDEF